MNDSVLVAFYRGSGTDHRGRTLSDIHEFDLSELEFHHDYIQWLFPLPEPSGANAKAPLLSKQDVAAFLADDALRRALLKSFALMLQFYGLVLTDCNEGIEIERGEGFNERRKQWLTHGNHNFLRISRILRSLALLGCSRHADAFLRCLEEIHAEYAQAIGHTTLGYWQRAVAART